MARPTIALCLIVKNERHNLPELFKSVHGCFDEIHITDTGSEDGTLEWLLSRPEELCGAPLFVKEFKWCDDFSKARNFSFDNVNTDFIMWLDADDVLNDAKSFIVFRDSIMASADYWFAQYDYEFDSNGKCVANFIRERVIRNDGTFVWNDFVHEGLITKPGVQKKVRTERVFSWRVVHRRSEYDRKIDLGRNLNIFRKHTSLNPRMKYYYGKELFDQDQFLEAAMMLMEAIRDPDLSTHDRCMGTQYAAMAAQRCGQHDKAIELALGGIKAFPNRAELWVLVADNFCLKNEAKNAIPFYAGALKCQEENLGGALFVSAQAYRQYPLNQLTQIFFSSGDFIQAAEYCDKLKTYSAQSASEWENKIQMAVSQFTDRSQCKDVTDIVFTCPPTPKRNWDRRTLEHEGLGGSETACIEVAEYLAMFADKVIVFNDRDQTEVISGVEYRPTNKASDYFKQFKPQHHIAWRHNTKLTEAPTVLWCHDLFCQHIDKQANYEKIFAMTEWHRSFIHSMVGIPLERIEVMPNGVDAALLEECKTEEKDFLSIIFSSSPDRGLDRAIKVVKRAREMSGLHFKLNVYYGFDNFEKFGRNDEADRIRRILGEHSDFVINHGSVKKEVLYREFSKAAMWVYPTAFQETFCITALEAIAQGCFPIVRAYGALQDTLGEYEEKGMCEILDLDCVTDAEIEVWAQRVIDCHNEQKWRRIEVNMADKSWEKVGFEWAKRLSLSM